MKSCFIRSHPHTRVIIFDIGEDLSLNAPKNIKGKGGVQMERFRFNAFSPVIVLLVAVCVGFLLLWGCATAPVTGEGPVATFKGKALSRYSATAEVSSLTYMMKDSKFHIKLGLKNISDKTKRYNVSINIPEGPSSGGYYPKQTSKQVKKKIIPSMKPGEELVREFRMYYDEAPKSVMISVDET